MWTGPSQPIIKDMLMTGSNSIDAERAFARAKRTRRRAALARLLRRVPSECGRLAVYDGTNAPDEVLDEAGFPIAPCRRTGCSGVGHGQGMQCVEQVGRSCDSIGDDRDGCRIVEIAAGCRVGK